MCIRDSFWADANNKVIPDLIDFTRTFFAKHTLLNVLTKYCVFTSENMLMVMRPYQITATERILNRIEIANNYKKYGTIAGGGYIWHTTGSGKTLTSFKTARLASQPVSYTHLEWQHPGQAAMKTLTDITPYTDYVKQLSALFESDEINDQEPVSYTHLDVYKRQVLPTVPSRVSSSDTSAGVKNSPPDLPALLAYMVIRYS